MGMGRARGRMTTSWCSRDVGGEKNVEVKEVVSCRGCEGGEGGPSMAGQTIGSSLRAGGSR